MTQTKKTRLCLISDTHTNPPNSPASSNTGYRHPLPTADILLHAGDITKVGYRQEHEAMISMLKTAPAELKIVIPGNHDISLDADYFYSSNGERYRSRRRDDPTESPDYIKALYTSPEAKAAGIVYLEEGTRTFTLSSGQRFTVFASGYTPEFCNWAFAYSRDIDRFNSGPERSPPGVDSASPIVPDFPGVDLMLTHGPPRGVLDTVFRRDEQAGCESLMRAVRRARPQLHVFGHIHEGYGAGRMRWGKGGSKEDTFESIRPDPESVLEDRCAYHNASGSGSDARPLRFGEETLFVNASVVTVAYQPVNAPWLVDLDLSIEGEGTSI